MIQRLKAYIKLQNKKLRSQRVEETALLIRKALYAKCQNDLERSDAMELANMQFEKDLEVKKQRQMLAVVQTEKAHDIMKLINLKY